MLLLHRLFLPLKLRDTIDFCIDEPFYKGYDEDNYREECGVWDAEQGEYIIFTESFSEWASRSIPKGIRPYKLDGTVACWRLEFTLNELGKAYVKVNKYLTVDVV